MRLVFKKQLSQKGDTIVEVLISMSILALVLGAAYATSNRSFRTGIDAGLRSQALSYAQQQVEIIKTVALNSPEKIGTYKVGRPFCIDPATTAIKEVDTDTNGDGENDACKLPISSSDTSQPYSLAIRYYASDAASGNPKNTFVVKAQWESSVTSGQEAAVTLHYKPQANFVSMNSSEISAPPPTESSPSAPNLPTISLTKSAASVISPSSATITWTITKATTCVASSSPASATWDGPITVASNGTATGSRSTGAIPASSDATFTVTCTRTGAGSKSASTTVGSQRITSFTGSPANPIAYGSNVTLSWASQYTNGCSGSGGSGGWAGGGKPASGSQVINNLTASTTFNLACSGDAGTVSASYSVTVNTPPPPSPAIYINTRNISNGGYVTLSWALNTAYGPANYCTASRDWSGTKPAPTPANPTRSENVGPLSGPRTYYFYLQCFGPGGASAEVSEYVNVSAPPSAPRPEILYWQWGGGNIFYYQVNNASSGQVRVDNPVGGNQPFTPGNGSVQSITAGNGGGGYLEISGGGYTVYSGHSP